MSGEGATQLERQLDALGQRDCYQVDEVLKESPCEVTQRVSLIGADGVARQPAVRKLIKRESGLGSVYWRLFEAQREGRRFKHIPTISECFERDDELVVVMELVPGETLEECVARLGPSELLARDVFPRLCDAVIELHEEFDPPIIHRDLKPSNVILSKGGLTLIDFGIAREYRAGARADTVRLGTHSFAPPEQFGFGQTTVRSDVFALGMMLYYCLAGAVPDTYVAEDDLMSAAVSSRMGAVIARATSLDPADRYATVRDLKRAFVEVAGPAVASVATPVSVPAAAPAAMLVAEPAQVAVPAQSAVPAVSPGANSGGMRFSALGRVWNVAILAVLAVFLCACVVSFFDLSPQYYQYPAWVNALAYFFFMPLFFVSSAWLLFDKRRLIRRFPGLGKRKFYHWLLVWAVASIVMVFGIGLTYSLAGVT